MQNAKQSNSREILYGIISKFWVKDISTSTNFECLVKQNLLKYCCALYFEQKIQINQ